MLDTGTATAYATRAMQYALNSAIKMKIKDGVICHCRISLLQRLWERVTEWSVTDSALSPDFLS